MYCASGMLWFCPLVPLGLPFRLGAPGKRNGGRAGGEVTRLAQMAWRSLRWPSTPLGCSALRHELGKRREPLPAASSTAQPLAHAVRGLDELLHTLLHLNHLLRHLLHCAATTFAISGHLVTAAGGEGGAGAPSSLRTAEPVAASFERAWSSWPSLLAWVSAICISAPSAPCFWDTCCAFCANQAWYSSATAANATGEISAAASRQGFCQRAVASAGTMRRRRTVQHVLVAAEQAGLLDLGERIELSPDSGHCSAERPCAKMEGGGAPAAS